MNYIDIHTHTFSANGISILNLLPSETFPETKEGFFSIGLHPWYIDRNDYQDKIESVRVGAKYLSCIAIGETGLDKLAKADFGLQKIIFEKHIEIAEENQKPLIIHCVRAYDDLVMEKNKTGSSVPWIVHGYNSKPGFAEKLIDEGMLVSFGRALFHPESNAQKVLEVISDDVFFLETDDSRFSIQDIFEIAAKIRKTSVRNLLRVIHRNFEKIFRLHNE